MLINGKWYSETEISAMISQLTADKKRIERQLEQGVKGMKTKEYVIKRKLMLYIHGIKIREI